MSTPDPRLLEFAGQVLAEAGMPEPPPYHPADGQSRDDWLAEVARVRMVHEEQARAVSRHVGIDGPPVGSIKLYTIPAASGSIDARVYTPEGTGPFPAIVYYHGGAWWMGGGDTGFSLTDGFCRTLCAELGVVVVNVDYGLAPEHPFPTQLEDSYAGLKWTAEVSDALNVDPGQIFVMGSSSGGNQAAAVCLLASERGGPAIRGQVLHVPALDLTGGSPSAREEPGAWEALEGLISFYAHEHELHDSRVSPLLAEDMSVFPPTVVVVGTFDPLRDDGHRFVARLREAGVDATLIEAPMFHAIALPETTQQLLADLVVAIEALRSPKG